MRKCSNWVAEFLVSTGTRKVLPVPCSKPPKTQIPSIHRPLLYLLWPILTSSISTSEFGPPKTSECCSKQKCIFPIEWTPINHHVLTYWQFSSYNVCWGWGNTSQRAQNLQVTSVDNLALPYQAPATKLFAKLCLLVTLVLPQHFRTVTCWSQRNSFLRRSVWHICPQSSQKHTPVITWWCTRKSRSFSSSSTMAANLNNFNEQPRHDILQLKRLYDGIYMRNNYSIKYTM